MPSVRPPWSDLRDDRARRFDDRFATVLAGLQGDAGARTAAWRQTIDLLSEPREAAAPDPALVTAVIAAAPSIAPAIRAEAARAAGFGRPPLALVVALGNDRPSIAAGLLRSIRLEPGDWAAVLPQLSPVARGILRARRDLDANTEARLAGFGPSDFVLSGSISAPAGIEDRQAAVTAPDMSEAADPAPGEPGMTRIADLVARIEAYRQTNRLASPSFSRTPPLVAFAFETDAESVIRWTDAVDGRAALIGMPLAAPTEPGGSGVDGMAFGAMRRRCAFREARLVVTGEGAASGEWRISGTPVFDPDSGRCLGYRGSARRPRGDQLAPTPPARADGAGETIRQVVHELRTPLNAIGGFAELIAGQIMGPVAAPYREAAGEIGRETERVLTAIEDLDLAARIDAGALDETGGETSLVHAVRAAATAQEAALGARGASVVLAGGDIDGAVLADPMLVDRLAHRFIATFAGFAAAGETLMLTLDATDGSRTVSLDRPRALAGLDREAMLASDDGEEGAVQLLGLAFAIRLITGLAATLGGNVSLDGARLTLSLPAAATARVEDAS